MRRTKVVTALTAGMVLVGAGTGLAAVTVAPSPTDSSGVIHGCWTAVAVNGTHAFVLQDAGSPCPKGTTAISWNQTGPAGPSGATGAAGPAGATGATGAPGPAGPPGDIGPAGPSGPPGAQGDSGPTGATGPTGPAGPSGASVLNGSGAPDDATGSDADFYIDTTTNQLYGPKKAGAWGAPVNLVGPKGEPGTTGSQGETGPTGPTGPAGPAGPEGPQGPAGTSNAISSGLVTAANNTPTTLLESNGISIGGYCSANPYMYVYPTVQPDFPVSVSSQDIYFGSTYLPPGSYGSQTSRSPWTFAQWPSTTYRDQPVVRGSFNAVSGHGNHTIDGTYTMTVHPATTATPVSCTFVVSGIVG